ncbi:MAG: PfkB family carbohydrate kinase, partial [Opitutales bacterium]
YPVTELRDPTGAGDSFAGALLGRLASRDQRDFFAIKEAMVYGTAVASLTVEAFGCDRLESAGNTVIEERAEELRALMRIER